MMQEKRVIPFLLLCVAVALILIGILNGEARVVFEKAIRICLECIGIG